jgi:hypothetical protein
MGTVNETMESLVGLAADKNMSIDQVMAMPEQDGWLYIGVQPRYTTSYVCSSFVVGCYKAAGLFDDLDINPQEFSPKDLTNLNFFNTTFERP